MSLLNSLQANTVTSTPQLLSDLHRLGRRQRVRAGWRWLQRTLWMAATAGLLIQLAGRRWPL
ncbi:MAG: hypothetical protein KDE54_25980, partial [Caldilineaceae bacterium]|nr:hypothetical protein [Caldilineaceae bacterium]